LLDWFEVDLGFTELLFIQIANLLRSDQEFVQEFVFKNLPKTSKKEIVGLRPALLTEVFMPLLNISLQWCLLTLTVYRAARHNKTARVETSSLKFDEIVKVKFFD